MEGEKKQKRELGQFLGAGTAKSLGKREPWNKMVLQDLFREQNPLSGDHRGQTRDNSIP